MHDSLHHKQHDKRTTKRTTDSPRGADPRFQAVSDEADQLIVSMTGENATLPAIAQALNAAGHTTATGQEGIPAASGTTATSCASAA
jgi:hypothetical protein